MDNADQVGLEKALEDYFTALARFVGVALSGLTPDDQARVVSEIEQRTATIQVFATLDPAVVVGQFKPVDRSKPPTVLFRLGAGVPSTAKH